ncbi:hypothetical protein PQX77_020547 [Marasmius sp. AFHP31]|nr:hypothetical protein PQX77_020547 [Marasmius sp. AFHP31]
MRFHPLVLLSLILPFVKHPAGFNIEGVPAQVTLNQIATVVWTHEQGDPTSFGLAAAPSPFSISSAILIGSAEAIAQQTGRMTFRFSGNVGTPLFLAVWDTSKESLEAVIRASVAPKFKGPTPITIGAQIANSQTTTPPSSPTSVRSPTTEPPIVRSSTTSPIPRSPATTDARAPTSGTTRTTSDSTTVPTSGTSSDASSDAASDTSGITSAIASNSPAASSTLTETATQPPSTSNPIATSSNRDTVKARIIAGSVVGCIAAILVASLGLWYWRRKRMWERIQIKRGHWQPLDDDIETVSPSSQAPSSHPPTVSKKLSGETTNLPVRREAEGRNEETAETAESQATDQPNTNLSWRLDLMSRDLAELRRMVHNSRGEEESLPDYSSR